MTQEDLVAIGSAIEILNQKTNRIRNTIPYLVYNAPKKDNKHISDGDQYLLDGMLKDLEDFFNNYFKSVMHKDAMLGYTEEALKADLKLDEDYTK